MESTDGTSTNSPPSTSSSLMVVEDDHDVREAMQLVLEGYGYDVITATNGREAIEKLATARPALILLDLMMPVMNGFQFLEAFAERDELAAIPVIVVSAFDDLARPLEGVAAIVPKPVDVAKMLSAVRQHLRTGSFG